MNLTTTLARGLATAGTLAVLAAGCATSDPTSATKPDGAGVAPAAGTVQDHPTPGPATRPPCRLTADQVERLQSSGIRPACVRARQREALRDYRRLTRVRSIGHL